MDPHKINDHPKPWLKNYRKQNMQNIRPRGTRVLIELLPIKQGTVQLPQAELENQVPNRGKVLAIGPKVNRKRINPVPDDELHPGDIVLLKKYVGNHIEDKLWMYDASEIEGIIEPETMPEGPTKM